MNALKIILKFFLGAIFLLILLFVSGKLFFEDEVDRFILLGKERFFPKQGIERTLQIGLASDLVNLDPLQNEVTSRERLVNIYEGLVSTGPFLEIQPALAISYGALNDTTWEFRLRKNVLFHNFQPLSADDVLYSIQEAWKNPRSSLSSLLASLESLEKIDNERFHIKTKSPDPLLLQKLAFVYIFPRVTKDSLLERPIGTGPYKFLSLENGTLTLERFPKYWGSEPVFSQVMIRFIPDRGKRKEVLKTGEVDLLTNVPPEAVPEVTPSHPLSVVTSGTLESNFLLFGMRGIFQERELRKAVTLAIDREEVIKLAFGFAKPASQFVGRGVFGFHPDISIPKPDLAAAKKIVESFPAAKTNIIKVDLPDGFQALGRFFLERLRRIGLKAEVKFHQPAELEALIAEGKSDLFFFGWRFTLGDASGLLESVMHSREGPYGNFNGMGYKNEKVDQLIEESEKLLKPLERLSKLREAMKILVDRDIVGIPLFIPEALYAKKKGLLFTPRIDNYVVVSEIE